MTGCLIPRGSGIYYHWKKQIDISEYSITLLAIHVAPLATLVYDDVGRGCFADSVGPFLCRVPTSSSVHLCRGTQTILQGRLPVCKVCVRSLSNIQRSVSIVYFNQSNLRFRGKRERDQREREKEYKIDF